MASNADIALTFLEANSEFAQLYKDLTVVHCTSSILEDDIKQNGLLVSPQLIPEEVVIFFQEMFNRYARGYIPDRQFMETHIFGTSYDQSQHEQRGIYFTIGSQLEPLDERPYYSGYIMPERMQFLLRELHSLSTLGYVDERDRNLASQYFDLLAKPYLDQDISAIAVYIDPMHPTIMAMCLNPDTLGKLQQNIDSDNPVLLDSTKSVQRNTFDIFSMNQEGISVLDIPKEAIIGIEHYPVDIERLMRICTAKSRFFPENPAIQDFGI